MNLCVIVAILAACSVDMAFSQRRPKSKAGSSEMCQSGDGSSYRGYISTSYSGRRCLSWKWFKHLVTTSKKDRFYCRNPDQSLMPWCFVRKGSRTVREFCDIPPCSTPPPAADTELTCGQKPERRMHKIVGGSFTAIESQPWIAAIFNKRSRFLCGGSLISPCWVLTAAHCFSDGEDTVTSHLSVYLGKTAINETDADSEQSFTVEKLIIHQNYNDSNYDNDLALLKIRNKNGGCAERSSSVRTVCLPPPHTQLPPGFTCSIAGYGKQRYESWRFSQYLKQAEVKLLSQTECTSELQYGNRISENMFCAGSPDWSTDACKGDSGGPLVCEASGRMFLFGVVSWGEGCATKNKPGVYTQVSNYNSWIETKTGLSEYTQGAMYPIK